MDLIDIAVECAHVLRMDFLFWLQIVAAVFAGCVAAGSFGYAIWYAARIERDGGDSWKLPLHVALMGAVPPIAMALIVLSIPV